MESEFNIKDLIVEENFSEGAYGYKEFKGKYKNNKDVIIKQYKSLSENEFNMVAIHKEIKNKLIVEFYGLFIDNNEKVNLVLENSIGKDLDYYVRNQIEYEKQNFNLLNSNEEEKHDYELKVLSVNEKLIIILQLCDILIYFKENKIIHKVAIPINIIINKYSNNSEKSFYNPLLYSSKNEKEIIEYIGNNNIQKNEDYNEYSHKYNVELKLCFDIKEPPISIKDPNYYNITVRYVQYSCPEQYEYSIEDEKVGKNLDIYKFDIWAIGCLISYLFTGVVPWTNKFSISIKIVSALVKKISFPIPDKWFQIEDLTKTRLTKILDLCFKPNYKERINSKGLKTLILALYFNKEFEKTLLEMKNIESDYFK